MKTKLDKTVSLSIPIFGLLCALSIATICGCAAAPETKDTKEAVKEEQKAATPQGDATSSANDAIKPGDQTDKPTPTCGDPELAAKYPACDAAKTEPDCLAAGGRWIMIGLSPAKMCQCYTGQEGCPCKAAGDCLSVCIAPLRMPGRECAREPTCSKVSKTPGCWCYYKKDGSVAKACID